MINMDKVEAAEASDGSGTKVEIYFGSGYIVKLEGNDAIEFCKRWDQLSKENDVQALKEENEALREALKWYGEEASALAKNSSKNWQAVEAGVTVLSLDGGARADRALKR